MTVLIEKHMSLEINKKSQQPIYFQVIEHFKEKIASGAWEPGFRLPPEDIFAQELGISRGTLRKAIKLLVEEQILETVHGKGTFVKKVDLETQFLTEIFDTAEKLNWFGVNLAVKVIEQKIVHCSDEKLAETLKIELGSKIIFSRKTYAREKEILAVQDTYVPIERVAALKNVNKMQGGELYLSTHKVAFEIPPQEIKDLFSSEGEQRFVCDFFTVMDERKIPVEYKRSWFKQRAFGNTFL